MFKKLRKLKSSESGFSMLELGLGISLVGLLSIGAISAFSGNNNSSLRAQWVNEQRGIERAIRAAHVGQAATATSSTIAGIVPETSLPGTILIDYATDDFKHALGPDLSVALAGATFSVTYAGMSAENCIWALGTVKEDLRTSTITSATVGSSAVTAFTNQAFNTACSAASNNLILQYSL